MNNSPELIARLNRKRGRMRLGDKEEFKNTPAAAPITSWQCFFKQTLCHFITFVSQDEDD
jgi:hypothetical protein